jgi:hypothetical protein
MNRKQHSDKKRGNQGVGPVSPEANKIGASTPFDFEAKNLTAYGGLLPVATMLEKLGFQQLIEETLTVKRVTRVMPMYQFVLAIVPAIYLGFSRLNHMRFIGREPMLAGILKVVKLPPQSTFWRFVASLRVQIAGQILRVQRAMRQRVWEAARVELNVVTLDTDTTVHTLFGHQMGGRRSYNPKNRGKKSYQPILTFLAETREYVAGELRNGDRPTRPGAKHQTELIRRISCDMLLRLWSTDRTTSGRGLRLFAQPGKGDPRTGGLRLLLLGCNRGL